MNRIELQKKLSEVNIPLAPYSSDGGYFEGKYVLGQADGGWEVYYCFYGQEHNKRFYKSEDEACADLYDRVRGYVCRYVGNKRYPSAWRFVTTARQEVFYIEGQAVPLDELHGSEEIVLDDPYYGQPRQMTVCRVIINGTEKQIAYGEVSNSVFACFIYGEDSPETLHTL